MDDDTPGLPLPQYVEFVPWSGRGRSGPSRRGLLVGGGIIAAAAAGGVALGLTTGGSDARPFVARPSRELSAAADAERALIATVDSALTRARAQQRAHLHLIRADHVAHLAAIEAEIADEMYPATRPTGSAAASVSRSTSSPRTGRPAGPAVSVATARGRERTAATAAAARALRLSGRSAALLASIAAAEATHAELLS
jgi:hypothetical protein